MYQKELVAYIWVGCWNVSPYSCIHAWNPDGVQYCAHVSWNEESQTACPPSGFNFCCIGNMVYIQAFRGSTQSQYKNVHVMQQIVLLLI